MTLTGQEVIHVLTLQGYEVAHTDEGYVDANKPGIERVVLWLHEDLRWWDMSRRLPAYSKTGQRWLWHDFRVTTLESLIGAVTCSP